MSFDTTYGETYHNRQPTPDYAAGVPSTVNARSSQVFLQDTNTSNNAGTDQYDVPRRKVIVQRVAAGISSERMSRPGISLRNSAVVVEEVPSRIPRSKSVDRITYKKQSQRKIPTAIRFEPIQRHSAPTTSKTADIPGSSEPKPIKGGPRVVKAVSVEYIADDSSSYQTADTHNEATTDHHHQVINSNVTITESRGVSFSGSNAQMAPLDVRYEGHANGGLVPKVLAATQEGTAEFGSIMPDIPVIEAF